MAKRKFYARYPDFYCIGAQKSGTTWLHENIVKHPNVWMPPVKELQYFNQLYMPDHRKWVGSHLARHVRQALIHNLNHKDSDEWDLERLHWLLEIAVKEVDDDWYGNIFSRAPWDTICGEITPEYSLLPAAGIAHVRKLNPNAKIIFLMRDPIDRALSHLRMLKSANANIDYLEAVKYKDIYDRSDYITIINKWIRAVSEKNILLLYLEDIEKKPFEALRAICEFIQIPFIEKIFTEAEKVIFKGEKHKVPKSIYEDLKVRYESIYDRFAEYDPQQADIWKSKHYQ
ncbi:MAG: sulfotransferase [Notoacmeibacter sp.]|nr:sulfotransferase [Notoacmeibacter sp.]